MSKHSDGCCCPKCDEVGDARDVEIARLQAELAKAREEKKKVTENAVRVIMGHACAAHLERAQRQSFSEFLAEHEGKCILCIEADLVRERARLDWLSQIHESNNDALVDLRSEGTLREAIDATMLAEGKA